MIREHLPPPTGRNLGIGLFLILCSNCLLVSTDLIISSFYCYNSLITMSFYHSNLSLRLLPSGSDFKGLSFMYIVWFPYFSLWNHYIYTHMYIYTIYTYMYICSFSMCVCLYMYEVCIPGIAHRFMTELLPSCLVILITPLPYLPCPAHTLWHWWPDQLSCFTALATCICPSVLDL